MRALGLDLGARRIGVAVSDLSGTIASPLTVVLRSRSRRHDHERIAALVREEEAECVVVGMPLTLRGEHGKQAVETDLFVTALRAVVDVPVETADERFTTALAQRFGGSAPEDAVAAAHLLQSWLDREARA